MSSLLIRGVYPAVITPFSDDEESIDAAALSRQIERLIAAGVHGLIIGGTTGEFTVLTCDERKLLHDSAVQAAAGRVPVIVQTGALSTREAVDLTRHAAQIGASGVMVIAPFYEGLTFEEAKQYYSDVAAASDLPVMIYHYPDATGIDLDLEGLTEIAQIPGVESLKFSSYDNDFFFEAREALAGKLQLINGLDTEMLNSLERGVEAVVLGTSNIVPEVVVEIYEALAQGVSGDRTRELWEKVHPLFAFIEEGKYVQKVKVALQLTGHNAGPTRRPLLPIANETEHEIRQLLETLPDLTPQK